MGGIGPAVTAVQSRGDVAGGRAPSRVLAVGYWAGVAAVAATVSFDVVQFLQLAGFLHFPLDEVLIYATSLCIVVPFSLEMLAFHYSTNTERRFFTHAALLFTALYAAFVTANYAVQLATVIPAKLRGELDAVRVLDQTPHSMFWTFDAIGYICMGFATLAALPAIGNAGFERVVRRAFAANALMTPLIAVVYFYPAFSNELLLLGVPWAVTAPLAMLLLALLLRRRAQAVAIEP
jgi:hypothetical protein